MIKKLINKKLNLNKKNKVLKKIKKKEIDFFTKKRMETKFNI